MQGKPLVTAVILKTWIRPTNPKSSLLDQAIELTAWKIRLKWLENAEGPRLKTIAAIIRLKCLWTFRMNFSRELYYQCSHPVFPVCFQPKWIPMVFWCTAPSFHTFLMAWLMLRANWVWFRTTVYFAVENGWSLRTWLALSHATTSPTGSSQAHVELLSGILARKGQDGQFASRMFGKEGSHIQHLATLKPGLVTHALCKTVGRSLNGELGHFWNTHIFLNLTQPSQNRSWKAQLPPVHPPPPSNRSCCCVWPRRPMRCHHLPPTSCGESCDGAKGRSLEKSEEFLATSGFLATMQLAWSWFSRSHRCSFYKKARTAERIKSNSVGVSPALGYLKIWKVRIGLSKMFLSSNMPTWCKMLIVSGNPWRLSSYQSFSICYQFWSFGLCKWATTQIQRWYMFVAPNWIENNEVYMERTSIVLCIELAMLASTSFLR